MSGRCDECGCEHYAHSDDKGRCYRFACPCKRFVPEAVYP